RTVQYTAFQPCLEMIFFTLMMATSLINCTTVPRALHSFPTRRSSDLLAALVPCVEPNVVPVIVTAAPTAPVEIDKLVMAGVTVKVGPDLVCTLVMWPTLPVLAACCMDTAVLDLRHVVTHAVLPWNDVV